MQKNAPFDRNQAPQEPRGASHLFNYYTRTRRRTAEGRRGDRGAWRKEQDWKRTRGRQKEEKEAEELIGQERRHRSHRTSEEKKAIRTRRKETRGEAGFTG